MKYPRKPGSERGASLVEFSFVLPLLLLLIFGLIDFGRFVITTTTISTAAREGARYGIGTGAGVGGVARYADCTGIRAAVKAKSVVSTITDADITISYDHGPATAAFLTCSGSSVTASAIVSNDRILVTVTETFNPITPFIDEFFGPVTINPTDRRTITKEV